MSSIAGRAAAAATVAALCVGGIVLASGSERSEPAARGGGGWQSLSGSIFQRTEVAAAAIGDRIYVVGGYAPPSKTVGSLAIYDISDDEWTRGRRAPAAVNHPGVVAHRGKLYLVGGQSKVEGSRGRTRKTFSYSPRRDRWKRLEDMPTKSGAMGMAARGGRIYVVGGYGRRSLTLRTLQAYSVRRDRWRTLAPMPTGRNHLTAVFAAKRLWAIGGRRPGTGGFANLGVVERYNPATDRWRRMGEQLNVPRSGITSAVAGGSIVVWGGERVQPPAETIAEVEHLPLTAADGPWNATSLPAMTVPRHGLGGAAVGDYIYALEGGPAPGLEFSNVAERLDVASLLD